MPEGNVSGIFPPVRLSTVDVTVYSIELRIPSAVSEELERYAIADGTSWKRKAKDALMFYRESFMTREDHAKANVEWTIRNFCRPPGRRRLSRKERERLYRRVVTELSELRANSSLGNLIVSDEIYFFLRRKMQSGTFASPIEVLEAAMPCLRAERGKPLRANFVDPNAPPGIELLDE